jgi:hypothetical protein
MQSTVFMPLVVVLVFECFEEEDENEDEHKARFWTR